MGILTRDKYLNLEELQSLKRVLKRRTKNEILIELALATGARASELLNIEWSDIDFSEGVVLVKGLKGSCDREIPVDKALLSSLLMIGKDGSSKVFTIKYRRLEQIWREYRPASKKFHSLRHTFAVNLYEKTKDLRLVQTALGHKSVTNTTIYAVTVDAKHKLREALL